MDERLLEQFRRVARGEISPEQAARAIAPDTDLGFAVVDDDRGRRTGLPEVVFGEGKTPDQLAGILKHLVGRGEKALATRVSVEKAAAVKAIDPSVIYEPDSRLLWKVAQGVTPFVATVERRLCVVAAGTSDRPVAEEAARTAEWFGLPVDRVHDVGVAGLHRLLARMDAVKAADAVIVVAGMDGALPSVVGGLVRTPIIAVPTSVGYGAAFGGLAPLLTMLNACAAGVAVVNIDNGFGAAQVAWRILGGSK